MWSYVIIIRIFKVTGKETHYSKLHIIISNSGSQKKKKKKIMNSGLFRRGL